MRASRDPKENPGGHNYATRRGFDYAIMKARVPTSIPPFRGETLTPPPTSPLASAMTLCFGETLEELEHEKSFAVQMVLRGNFQNEIWVRTYIRTH